MMLAAQLRYSVEAGVLLLASCVILGPLIAERLRIPGLIGLIAAGTLLGPNVLAWLQPGGFVATVGAAGLLYLMFVAGLELDLKAYVANRTAALTFGLLTFGIPFGLSLLVGHYYLDLGFSATALVGAMWASHTVVAYPEAKAAGIDRARSVGVSLAATVITDVIALVVLAIAASSSALGNAPEVAAQVASGTIQTNSTLPLWSGLLLLVVVCFGVIPRATRWLFSNVLHRRTERFVWALVAMSAGAVTGLLGGIEGLVGAFLAGIGMNAAVPARSELMERIEFIGSSLLIPAFLISVGLSIDPGALVDPSTLVLAAVFTATVIVGKALAAVTAGMIGSFDRDEIVLMTALTIGQAAATLAIAQVGVGTGLFDDEILNAAVVTVVATVLVTSLGTRIAARRLGAAAHTSARLGDHVLVLAPTSSVPLSEFASLASAMVGNDGGLITPCAVRTNRGAGGSALVEPTSEQLRALDETLVRLGHDTDRVHRVADTLSNGIGHLADELAATLLVVAVPHERILECLDLGGEIAQIAAASDIPIAAMAPRAARSRRVVVVTGTTDRRADHSADLQLALDVASKIAVARSIPLTVFSPNGQLPPAIERGRVIHVGYEPGSGDVIERLDGHDLLVVPVHVLTAAGAVDRGHLQRALANVSLVVVGGPHRLTSAKVPSRPLHGVITPAMEETTEAVMWRPPGGSPAPMARTGPTRSDRSVSPS
jgi:Kef-type K+ transport system membrane component KefB